jgi:hypothetical protein
MVWRCGVMRMLVAKPIFGEIALMKLNSVNGSMKASSTSQVPRQPLREAGFAPITLSYAPMNR